jgi:NAD(P)H dehydrogenase (quinone)
MSPAPKVNIIIYTLYHHIYTLALSVQEGLKEAGVDAKILQGKSQTVCFVFFFSHMNF